jgi:hypothetical protein
LLLTIGKPLYKPVSIPTVTGSATVAPQHHRVSSRIFCPQSQRESIKKDFYALQNQCLQSSPSAEGDAGDQE